MSQARVAPANADVPGIKKLRQCVPHTKRLFHQMIPQSWHSVKRLLGGSQRLSVIVFDYRLERGSLPRLVCLLNPARDFARPLIC